MAEDGRGWHGDSEGHSEAAKQRQAGQGEDFMSEAGGDGDSGDGSMTVKEAGQRGGEKSGGNN